MPIAHLQHHTRGIGNYWTALSKAGFIVTAATAAAAWEAIEEHLGPCEPGDEETMQIVEGLRRIHLPADRASEPLL